MNLKKSNRSLFNQPIFVVIVAAVLFFAVISTMIAAAPLVTVTEYAADPDTQEFLRAGSDVTNTPNKRSRVDDALSFETEAPETSFAIETEYRALLPNAPETFPPVIPETKPLPETVKEMLPPETEPETEPETLPPVETDPPYIPPEVPKTRLSDKLGVSYTISPNTLKNYTQEDLRIAATVVQFEVVGVITPFSYHEDSAGKYREMLSVAQCIRNRINASCFKPNTIPGIVYQHTEVNGNVIYQFYPEGALDNYTPSDEAYQAVYEVMVEGVSVLSEDYYYFCATDIEEFFECGNGSVFKIRDDGSYEKTRGLVATFYAGRY